MKKNSAKNAQPAHMVYDSICLKFFRALFLVIISSFVMMLTLSSAKAVSIPIIRDAEIENELKNIARPLLNAAGLGGRDVDIVIVNSRVFNAFVADSRRIFINMGAITQSENPNQIAGVIAHEIGHLAGGHLNNLRQELRRANAIAIAAALIGAGVSAAGAATGNDSLTSSGQGVILGGQGSALSGLRAYQRSEEIAADRAAIKYLNATGQSAKGMLDVFEVFASQTMFTKSSIDPYARSHPMPRDRINSTQRLAQNSRYFDQKDKAQDQLRYDLIKAKLFAYYASSTTTFSRYNKNRNDLPALYARAIATYRASGAKKALPIIDTLINAAPQYPYFHEFKGQMLFESARVSEAIPAISKAVSLLPDEGQFRILLGRAYLAKGGAGNVNEAIKQLEAGIKTDPEIQIGFQALAMAYGQKGEIGKAELVTAQGNLRRNDKSGALRHAKRAQNHFSKGSSGWLKAEDIIQSLGG